MPLMGITGMMKKSVMKRMPFLSVKFATVPHCPHRVAVGACSLPQLKNLVPIIKKNIISCFRVSRMF